MVSTTSLVVLISIFSLGTLLFAYPLNDDNDDSSEYGLVPGKVATNCSCGWANKQVFRIIGGRDADEHEWPMMVGFVAKKGTYIDNNLICGGTLITRKHVVTAAHCVHTVSGRLVGTDQLHLVLGAHRLSKINYEDPEVMRKPERFIVHPKYKSPGAYDIAIVILEKKVEFSRIIGPACMPTERMYPMGKKLTAIGWGFIDFRANKPDALQEVRINVVSPSMCFKYKEFDRMEGYQYCTHQGNYSGQCVGDSGGPILWRDPDTNMYTLLAAPSFSDAGCVLTPAVVSDITYYAPWIQKVISETYPEEKTCSKVATEKTNKETLYYPEVVTKPTESNNEKYPSDILVFPE